MQIKLNNVRLMYAKNLFVKSRPKDAGPEAKDKYQFEGVIEPGDTNDKALLAAILVAATEEWGENAKTVLKAVNAAGKIWARRDGDTKTDKEGEQKPKYAGKIVISAKNEIRPLTIDGARNPVTQDDNVFYSGCFVNVIVDVKAGSKPSKQVYAYLSGVQFAGDGERIGPGVVTPEAFEEVKGVGVKTAEAEDLF
jgi:hypothetical protein